jgi:hypothetical protein
MKAKIRINDPDIAGSLPAMRRAALRARRVAAQTGTPLVVMHKGKIVYINPSAKPTARRNRRAKKSA